MKQQSAEWLDSGHGSARLLSKFNTMKMGRSSRDLMGSLKGWSTHKETFLEAQQRKRKTYTADTFGTAVAVRNQALK